jgi:hypothetical protein
MGTECHLTINDHDDMIDDDDYNGLLQILDEIKHNLLFQNMFKPQCRLKSVGWQFICIHHANILTDQYTNTINEFDARLVPGGDIAKHLIDQMGTVKAMGEKRVASLRLARSYSPCI